MKKLTSLSLLSLLTINFLLADEYISDAYFEEIMTQSELIYESIESLPIAKTVEEEAREEAKKRLNEEFVQEEPVSSVVEEKQSIQKNTYLNTLKQARDEGKIIMLTIGSTDCKYCDEMEESTLSDSSVKKAIEANFINITYNQDLDTLPLGLQEGMIPNFIFVNTNEDILNIYPGMRSVEEFKEVLEQILAM